MAGREELLVNPDRHSEFPLSPKPNFKLTSMQRRAGKGHAHISPPIPQGSAGMGSERLSRLSQRNFGVTNRIWLILSLILAVIFFTHYIVPSNQPHSRHTFSTANLKPKNYLNVSQSDPNPFEFCPIYGPGDELGAKYGALVLSQSRLHLGSGARVQRLIQRVLGGQPVTISILGGSVSACHGAGDDPVSPQCYPSQFFQWWNTVFPHPASELTNGAMRRTTSEYFSFCNAHHLPDQSDLVILEFDVDDSPDRETLENFELLVRSILIRPDQPAVIVLGHFSPQVHHDNGFAGPDHWHNIVAQFFDVPHISVKSAFYRDYISDPASIDHFYADPVLANPAGHEVISDVLVSYFQSQICAAWSVAAGRSYDALPSIPDAPVEAHGIFGGVGQRKGSAADLGVDNIDNKRAAVQGSGLAPLDVPAARINTRPNDGRVFEEVAPFCVSANDLINPLPPSLFYGSGWIGYHPTPGVSSLLTSEHYWYSTLPTSKLRIPIQVGAGDIGIYYLREPINDVGEGSAIECWVDDNYPGAVVIENAADVEQSVTSLEIIDHFVSRGSHFVECQLLGEEGVSVSAFKIIGIFAT